MVFARPHRCWREVTLQQLAEAPWILREHGSGTREIVDYVLLSHLPAFHLGMELGTRGDQARGQAWPASAVYRGG